jgi:hypothetical protein
MYVHYVHYNKLNSQVEWCTVVRPYYPRWSSRCLVTSVVSARKGCTNLWYNLFCVQKKWVILEIFKKYLQCILAAKILTVNFVVCTLPVKKKKNQGRFRHVGSDPLVSIRVFRFTVFCFYSVPLYMYVIKNKITIYFTCICTLYYNTLYTDIFQSI